MLYLSAVMYREFCSMMQKKKNNQKNSREPKCVPFLTKPHLLETFVTMTSSFYY